MHCIQMVIIQKLFEYRIVPNLSPPLIIAPPLFFPGSWAMIQEKMEILDKLRINLIFKVKNVLNILYDL